MATAKVKCKLNHRDADVIPRFLCRVCTPFPKASSFIATQAQAKLDPRLAQLDPDVRSHVESEIRAGRFRLHWLDEPGVVSRVTFQVRHAQAKRNVTPRERRPAKVKVERPADTVTLAELAAERKHPPRIYRAAARNIKDVLVPLQVNGMKYVYHKGDTHRVLSLIQQELERCRLKKSQKQSKSSRGTTPFSVTTKSSNVDLKKTKRSSTSKRSTKAKRLKSKSKSKR